MTPSVKLSEREILVLINDYIGVDQGYLRGFSYSFHDDFYARFCNLDVDVAKGRLEHGTTRLTFAAILRVAEPTDQAKIVLGVFQYLPLNGEQSPIEAKRKAAHELLTSAIGRIRGQPVVVDDLAIRHETIDRAIRDADVLIREQGNTSRVDRVHTALHGYLKAMSARYNLLLPPDPDVGALFKALKTNVAALRPGVAREEDISQILGALSTIVRVLNPIRNQASMAHPNEALLDVAEAALVIDTTRTVLNYLNKKLV